MNFSIEYFVRHEASKLLRESKTPGTLTYKRSFVCDQCGKIRSCVGEGRAGPEAACSRAK